MHCRNNGWASARPSFFLPKALPTASIYDQHIPTPLPHSSCAYQVTGVVEMDHGGAITKPACCALHPSGMLFGCSERSMTRQMMKSYMHMPGKHAEALLADDKVRGALRDSHGWVCHGVKACLHASFPRQAAGARLVEAFQLQHP